MTDFTSILSTSFRSGLQIVNRLLSYFNFTFIKQKVVSGVKKPWLHARQELSFFSVLIFQRICSFSYNTLDHTFFRQTQLNINQTILTVLTLELKC